MESKEYQVLHYEIIEDKLGYAETTAEVLEIINGRPTRIYVVPVTGKELTKGDNVINGGSL